jgi:hypothetical protein
MKGVYCVDIIFEANPISQRSKLIKVNEVLEDWPLALDENQKPMNTRFLKHFIKNENIDKYRIKYEIIIKKILSGICYKE